MPTKAKSDGGAKAEKPTGTKESIVAFGVEVRLARIRAGTFQRAIAEHMGWHPTAVSQLERGDRAALPDLPTVTKLDDFLEANGTLIEAAGFKVTAQGRKKPEVSQVISLPSGLSRREIDRINAYIDLVVHDSRRAG